MSLFLVKKFDKNISNFIYILRNKEYVRSQSKSKKKIINYKHELWLKKFLNNVNKLSKYFFLNLNKIKEKYPNIIKQIRGRGFLIGIQLHQDQTNFIKKLMDNKLLTIRAAENVVRILPPLNVKKSEINLALKIINKVCRELN